MNTMTENEKKLLQAKHRLEEAQMRDRKKERNARTRRLIQEGAVLEKVLPEVRTMEPSVLEDYLIQKLPRTIKSMEVSGKPWVFLFPLEGRTYSPPARGRRWHPPAGRHALEGTAASAEASRQCHNTCGCCCHRLCRRQNTTKDVLVRWVTNRNPPAACANLPPAALPQIGRRLRRPPFLFCEKETKSQSAEQWCHGSLPHLRARTQRV